MDFNFIELYKIFLCHFSPQHCTPSRLRFYLSFCVLNNMLDYLNMNVKGIINSDKSKYWDVQKYSKKYRLAWAPCDWTPFGVTICRVFLVSGVLQLWQKNISPQFNILLYVTILWMIAIKGNWHFSVLPILKSNSIIEYNIMVRHFQHARFVQYWSFIPSHCTAPIQKLCIFPHCYHILTGDILCSVDVNKSLSNKKKLTLYHTKTI